MQNPIISWLFETDAVRVCPQDHPFWYTSGKLGPFYINTQFLFGSEDAANALLLTIERACAGDKLAFYDAVWKEIEAQLDACPIYAQLVDLLVDAAKALPADFISGGERRDFFFSMPVARRLGKGHLSIFKDLSSVYTDKTGASIPAEQADLAGKRALHVADLVTVASSYLRAWIPAVKSLGASIAYSLAVVDRDQGGKDILANAGCPLTTLVTVTPALFETARDMGRITDEQLALVRAFMDDPDAFMRDFLLAHPSFLAEEIARGGKSAQRAELCISSGFAPEAALPRR